MPAVVRVKICGITNERDAYAAVDAGADAVGFVFEKGPRAVRPEAARRISRKLPAFLHRVGVFVDAPAGDVNLMVRACGFSWAQLHGDETEEYASGLNVPWVKVFCVADGRVLQNVRRWALPLFQLDTFSRKARGGTGKVFDWDIARRAGRLGRVVLSGGLTPENVREAVATVRPFALDVSSGVEARPGKKDARKLRRFVEEARA